MAWGGSAPNPTTGAKTDMVKLALDKGVSNTHICKDLDISKTSLYRIIGGAEGLGAGSSVTKQQLQEVWVFRI